MLDILKFVEIQLPEMLRNPEIKWNSLDITYEFPHVERIWLQYNNYRISLHCIHPCTAKEAFFHRHAWPSAMRIVKGKYEMKVGYSRHPKAPPIAATMLLLTGSEYEMIDPCGWHSVRPIDDCVYTVMVSGLPWGRRKVPKSKVPLLALSAERIAEIINVFKVYYPV